MSSNDSPLKICLFGAMSVEADGIVVSSRLARKELWLLAILALRPDRAMPRDTLVGMLWPECQEEQALYNLRRSLTRLRSALGNQAAFVQQVKPRSLVFAAPGAWVDVLEFDRLAASDDPRLLAEAVHLCSGPLLQNCYEEWAQPERLAREFACRRALETLANHALAQGDWLEAAKYCRLHIAADPLHEPAHRLLMQALARSGNHAGAMQAFRDLRVRLRAEINADPDPQTLACYEAIRHSAKQTTPILRAAPTSSAALHASSSNVVSPPVSAPSPTPLLPQPLTRLIGRDLEVGEVCGHLAGARLVTLLGAGGVGKTRLSIEVAHRTAGRFADGAVFVELAPLNEDMGLEQAVARTLGITEKPDEALLTTLTQTLHAQERLLVLDNCEHLRTACAQFAHALLSACPRLRILATSRQALGLPGEIVWRVPSLAAPPETHLEEQNALPKMDDALEYPAVQLFLERVRQTCPEFRLLPEHLPPIAQICRRLDGIPLAIELAAYRVRALSPEKIAARLADRFHLLTGGGTASLPRQQTLRALIDWSYRLLEPNEQRLFARLSAFSGGWTLEAAETVCVEGDVETWEVLDLLTSLADKSLIAYQADEGGGRYHFLESIREYACERLTETGEAALFRQKHAEYYSALAVETEPRLLGPEQGELQEMLEREHDNMRAVLVWGRESAPGAATAFRLVSRLWRFWMQRGYWREGREHLQTVLDREQTEADADSRCRALNGAGILAYRMGDFTKARPLLEQSLALARRTGNERAISAALANLGHIPAAQGQYLEARALYAEALELQRQQGNESGAAYSLLGLGNVAASLNELEAARGHFEEALAHFRRLGDAGGELLALGNSGWCLLLQNDPPSAIVCAEQALALCRQLKRPEAEGLYLPLLGAASEAVGDLPRARECTRQALRVSLQLGDKRTLAATLESLAAHYLRREEDWQAARYYGCTDIGYAHIALSRSIQEQQNRAEAFAILRARMGDTAFTAAFAAGQQLSLETLAREVVSE